eukprot:TRINITY_DN607_c0_g1_i4.p3 TRINITY_DN607_c0_g1~~TRINITY_DN607_c0_g1_i4.p3  ORF type:complete len:135 (-),score=19.99 TRINITY_DN607_c0_g1_i4:580-984(-)
MCMLEQEPHKLVHNGVEISDDKILDGSVFDDIAVEIKQLQNVVDGIQDTEFKEHVNRTIQKIKHLREFSDELKNEVDFAAMLKKIDQEFDNTPPEIDHGATPEEVLQEQRAKLKALNSKSRKSLIFSNDTSVIM